MIDISIFFESTRSINLIHPNIVKLSKNIFNDFNYSKAKLNIILTSDQYLLRMKKEYFKLEQFTDVISFTINDNAPYIEGEIYISYDRVIDNASTFCVSIDNELRRVISHGLLHLVGLDDASLIDKKKMTDYENKYIDSISRIIDNG